MIGKIISTFVLAVLGIAALTDFIMIYRGRLGQFGFLSVSFGIFSLCAAVFVWRFWDKIRESYTYRQDTDREGVELPRAAWSERFWMGAMFNLRNRPERPHSENGG